MAYQSDFVKPWWFINPLPTLIILFFYLFLVLFALKRFMKNRPPYQLKKFIFVYNTYQIIFCIYYIRLLYLDKPHMWKIWTCYSNMESYDPDEYYIWNLQFWSRIIDLIETCVFVLRKKDNQVSFLHLFHHFNTTLIVALAVHYHFRDQGNFGMFLNAWCHLLMYVYYQAAALLPASTMKRFEFFKKAITSIQMIQFGLMLLQGFIHVFLSKCNYHKGVMVPLGVIAVFFYMFLDFYKTTYLKEKVK